MATLLTIPTEIRLRIWDYLIPEEVEVWMSLGDDGKDTAAIPSNPTTTLLLVCKKTYDEVSTLPAPRLSVKTPLIYLLVEEPNQILLRLCNRIKILHGFWSDCKETSSTEVEKAENSMQPFLEECYKYVQKVCSNQEERSEKRHSGEVGWLSRIEVHFDVSDPIL